MTPEAKIDLLKDICFFLIVVCGGLIAGYFPVVERMIFGDFDEFDVLKVLAKIQEEKGLSIAEIAVRIHMPLPRVERIVRRLERKMHIHGTVDLHSGVVIYKGQRDLAKYR